MNLKHIFKKKYIVAVHDGSFHADEIFACAVMNIYLRGAIRIIRTRDQSLIEKADYVLDVGGEYNHEARLYDHHQPEGAGIRDNGIPYATAGLIWEHYGKQIIKNREIWQIIDNKLAAPIDAVDNGIDLINTNFEGIFPYGLQQIIATRRPTWREETEVDLDKEFLNLVEFMTDLLNRELEILRDTLFAKKQVTEAINISPYTAIVVLHKNLPFEETIINEHPDILFVVSPRLDGTWRIAGIKKTTNSFELRKTLPKSWAGLKGESLQLATGEKGARFCHRALFLLVADDRETALRLAQKALILE